MGAFNLTTEEEEYLEEYLGAFEDSSFPSDKELSDLVVKSQEGDGAAAEKLLFAYLPMAAELAGTFAGQGVFLEDLIGEANLALTQAVSELSEHIDTKDGESVRKSLDGFFGSRMLDACETMIREEIAEQDADRELADRVNAVAEAAAKLSRELLHKVSVSELVENTEFTAGEIEEVLRILGNGRGDIEISEDQ